LWASFQDGVATDVYTQNKMAQIVWLQQSCRVVVFIVCQRTLAGPYVEYVHDWIFGHIEVTRFVASKLTSFVSVRREIRAMH
jgi:hypothetical protein